MFWHGFIWGIMTVWLVMAVAVLIGFWRFAAKVQDTDPQPAASGFQPGKEIES